MMVEKPKRGILAMLAKQLIEKASQDGCPSPQPPLLAWQLRQHRPAPWAGRPSGGKL